MIHEEKKTAKIVEELTLFFFALGADKIQSGIEKKGKDEIGRASCRERVCAYV